MFRRELYNLKQNKLFLLIIIIRETFFEDREKMLFSVFLESFVL